MRLERVRNINEAMKSIEPDDIGYSIMKDKTQILGFKISRLKIQAMQILKQDALSNGAELVTPRDAILCKKTHYDCLLYGTPKALKLLIMKMQMQPFGLKAMAKELKEFVQIDKNFDKEIMGIINVDSNSFYEEFSSTKAIEKIHEYIEIGTDIIDIGAVSSRPGSKFVPEDIEIKRLQDIFNEVKSIKTTTKFSIDTYNKETAKIAIDNGFSIINDISGKPENMIEILKSNPKTTYILTHIQGEPSNMQDNCNYTNLILDIDEFFEQKLAYLAHNHCKNIILDVGIGFAKTMQQNIQIISQLSHFKHFKKPLLIGTSHKSFLAKIIQLDTKENDNTRKNYIEATLLTHFISLQNGADIIRVHDIREHKEMLKIFKIFHINDVDIL